MKKRSFEIIIKHQIDSIASASINKKELIMTNMCREQIESRPVAVAQSVEWLI